MNSALPSDATVCCLSPSMGGAGGAAFPSGAALPHEPEEPSSLEDAEHWVQVYDEYLQNLRKLAREHGAEDELRSWIERCVKRRHYWARARDQLRFLEEAERGHSRAVRSSVSGAPPASSGRSSAPTQRIRLPGEPG